MTREEAIKVASEMYGWLKTDREREAFETLIPELAENEDERVRKAILGLTYLDGIEPILTKCSITAGDIRAYLEKQKEQKPVCLQVKGDGVYKICPHCKERMIRDDSKVYTSMPPQYGYNCPKCGALEFDTVMYDSPAKEEQKPSIFPPGLGEVHWNPIPSAKKELMEKAAEKPSKEEYVKKFKALCDAYEIKLPNREYDIYGLCEDLHKLFGDIQKSAEWDELQAEFRSINEAFEDGKKEVIANPDKYGLCKPAERNKATINGEPVPTENHSVNIALSKEEKERIRQSGRLDVCYDPEKYGLCHKIEWSEEDKRKLNRIYEILGYAADDKGFLTSKRIIGDREAIELQDFLKSIRPSWKPSEEEMGALAEAMERNDKIGYFLHQLHEELKHNYKL